jgi:hypothetical protein
MPGVRPLMVRPKCGKFAAGSLPKKTVAVRERGVIKCPQSQRRLRV